MQNSRVYLGPFGHLHRRSRLCPGTGLYKFAGRAAARAEPIRASAAVRSGHTSSTSYNTTSNSEALVQVQESKHHISYVLHNTRRQLPAHPILRGPEAAARTPARVVIVESLNTSSSAGEY